MGFDHGQGTMRHLTVHVTSRLLTHPSSDLQVLSNLSVDGSKGLTSAEVLKRRAQYGPNELDKEEGKPLWKLVLQQFDDLLVKILLGAAILSFVRAAPS
jgi:Ca2+-transporting ATPase